MSPAYTMKTLTFGLCGSHQQLVQAMIIQFSGIEHYAPYTTGN